MPSSRPATSAARSAAAQRRIHFVGARVVGLHVGIGQREVVRRHLAGDAHAARAGGADQRDALGGGDVLDVERGAGGLGQRDVARDDLRLGLRRHAGQVAAFAMFARMHHTGFFQHVVLGVFHQHLAEQLGGVQRFFQQRGVRNHTAIVGEGGGARGGQRREVGQLLALAVFRHAARRQHARQPDLRATLQHELDDVRRRVRRQGVRHGNHGGEAAARRRAGAGLDGFRGFAARLAQMDVQIDQARRDDEAGSVEDGKGRRKSVEGRGSRAERGDAAIDDEQVARRFDAGDGIEQASVFDQHGFHIVLRCR